MAQVAAIGFQRVLGRAPFDRQHLQEIFDVL
jgi:hypothetical protein